MSTKENVGVCEARDKLSQLFGRFNFVEGSTIEEVNNKINDVIFSFNVYTDGPKFLISRSLYPEVVGGKTLARARFIIRPSAKDDLTIVKMRKTFELRVGESFYDDFIENVIQWYEGYAYYSGLQDNLDSLNKVVQDIVQEHEIDFDVSFGLGKGLLDASDKHVVVGLTVDTIASLSKLPLFDTFLPGRSDIYKEQIAATLKECVRPFDLVKVRTQVTRDLDIFERRSMVKLIRKFVKKNITHVRVGTGYVDTEDTFAVIDKTAVTAEAAKLYLDSLEDKEGVLVLDNTNATTKEKAEGKDKIIVEYRIKPFRKEDGVLQELSLENIV